MKIDIKAIRNDENFNVKTCPQTGLHLVTPLYAGTNWNKDNLIFRSSIWNNEGELISGGFPKFFNWGESSEVSPPPENIDETVLVEKIDGSCLIVSYYKGNPIIRTRGTFDATKLENGHEIDYLMQKYPNAFNNIMLQDETLSFIYEWVSPNNKIVLDYGDKPDIKLIGIVDHSNYSLYKQDKLDRVAYMLNLKRPNYYNSIEEMYKESEKELKEGVCVYVENDFHVESIHKIKTEEYLRRHRLKSHLENDKQFLEYILNMSNDVEYIQNLTEESLYNHIKNNIDYEVAESLKTKIMIFVKYILKDVDDTLNDIYEFVYRNDLRNIERKTAAEIIFNHSYIRNYSTICFHLLNNEKISKKLFDKLVKNGEKKLYELKTIQQYK